MQFSEVNLSDIHVIFCLLNLYDFSFYQWNWLRLIQELTSTLTAYWLQKWVIICLAYLMTFSIFRKYVKLFFCWGCHGVPWHTHTHTQRSCSSFPESDLTMNTLYFCDLSHCAFILIIVDNSRMWTHRVRLSWIVTSPARLHLWCGQKSQLMETDSSTNNSGKLMHSTNQFGVEKKEIIILSLQITPFWVMTRQQIQVVPRFFVQTLTACVHLFLYRLNETI